MVEWYYTLWKRGPGGVWVCVSAVEVGGGVRGGSSLLYSLAVSRSDGASGAWVSDWVFELANSVAPTVIYRKCEKTRVTRARRWLPPRFRRMALYNLYRENPAAL